MTRSSKHGPGIYVGVVCMVGAPASQGPQAEFGCPDTKHILEERSYFVYS